jgi:adenosylcobinamide kinase/adenosylcobinamide-phosphate guanylyltransferase
VANLIQKGHREKAIKNKINRMLNIAGKINAAVIFVSNEVGLGIVPVNKLARNFRDLAGWINQMVAEKAGRVFFVVSGIPWRLK